MKASKFRYSDILFTTNYSAFKNLLGNREVNLAHVDRLAESFDENYLFSPIIVNEKYQVIDGQHRLMAAEKMGLPVYYIIVHGYGIKEVQILNTNGNEWMNKDFLKSFCDKKVQSYLDMKKFMEDFPMFGIKTVLVFLNLNDKTGELKNYRLFSKEFSAGRLHIPNLKYSYNVAQKIIEYKEYFDGFAQTKFIMTLISLFKNPNFEHEELVKKLRIQPNALYKCANGEQYKALIEDIYNYKRKDKVNLRF